LTAVRREILTVAQNPKAIEHRNALIAKILQQYDEGAGGNVSPVVSLEDFFESNWDEHSLAPNMAKQGRPPLQECYRMLRDIRSRRDVQDVLVAIHETPEADEELDFDIWPDSDTVYVLSSATRAEVAAWAAPLKPNEVNEKWSCGTGEKPKAAPELQPGMKVYALWWD
jgi:hypothetical protein